MTYEKQSWTKYDDLKTEEENIENGAVVTDNRMNHIEEGISENDGAITDHVVNMNNPHGVTKTQLGLDKVDNIQQAAKTDFDTHVADKNNPHSVTKDQVGLSAVDNVQQAPKTTVDAHLSNTQNPHNVTAAQVGAYAKTEADTKFATAASVAQKANDNAVMHLTGDETASGTKTFDKVVANSVVAGTLSTPSDISWTNFTASGCKYKKEGNLVTIEVNITPSSTSTVSIGTLPASCKPDTSFMFNCPAWATTATNDKKIQINAGDGSVSLLSPVANQQYVCHYSFSI